jgi:hypothetical protein
MAKITAPEKDFNGDIAGVQFTHGSADTDNEAVISYCAGAGYTVELDELPEPDPEDPEREPQPPADNEHVAPDAELFPEPEAEPVAPKPRRNAKPE